MRELMTTLESMGRSAPESRLLWENAPGSILASYTVGIYVDRFENDPIWGKWKIKTHLEQGVDWGKPRRDLGIGGRDGSQRRSQVGSWAILHF